MLNFIFNQKPFAFARLFLFIILFFSSFLAHADQEDIYPFSNQEVEKRFSLLTHEIRCIVCQNQNLAESDAPLALDLRNKIYHLVLQNKSNDEIKKYLVSRYGDFILFKPPFNNVTLALWLFPAFAFLFIFIVLK